VKSEESRRAREIKHSFCTKKKKGKRKKEREIEKEEKRER
jgi:hypothetical protein